MIKKSISRHQNLYKMRLQIGITPSAEGPFESLLL